MQNEYESILIDLRNHGSSEHQVKMGYMDMATDVIEFIAANDLEPITILGHSMGGKVAMTVALNYPDYVEKLIVVDIAPIRYKDNLTPTITAMLNLDLNTITSRSKAETLLAPHVPDRAMRLFLLQNLHLKTGLASWSCNVAAIRDAMDEIIGPIPNLKNEKYLGPCTFIRGENSDYVGKREIAKMNELFPRNRISTIRAAAHWPHTENPKEFMKATYEALKMYRDKT